MKDMVIQEDLQKDKQKEETSEIKMKSMTRIFFEASAKVEKIPISLAHKIIDGRYKPYLSALDDEYYNGNDVYDAKFYALQAAVKKFGRKKTIEKLKKVW